MPRRAAILPLVERRYAILDDNQGFLSERLETLRRVLPELVTQRICAAMVIGSVADGCARDESDLDLLVVLKRGTPRRADYEWWDREVRPRLGERRRFPVEPVIVGLSALASDEPHLRRALHEGIVIWDPGGVFHDQSQAGS